MRPGREWDRRRPPGAEVGDWDAALRLSDRVTHHLAMDREANTLQWIAARLADGGGDNTVYASRWDAVCAQIHPRYYTFLRIPPDGMSPRVAWRFLVMARQMWDAHKARWDQQNFVPIMPGRREAARLLWR